jgi:CubicO group peptidase (beta-lactamase class C family)
MGEPLMPARSGVLDRRTLLAAGLAAVPAAAGAQDRAALPASTALLERGIAGGRFPGGVAALGRGSEAPAFASRGTLAFDSKAPVGPDTLWRIYSMTKPVTGMAAMLLIDERKLKLDQPVADFIPGFAKARVLADPETLESRPAAQAMTVRHLLTHTSGIGAGGALPHPMPPKLTEAYERLGLIGLRGVQAGAKPVPRPGLAEFCERLATLPLLFDPGARWNYSLSTDVLGRVIELASGQPFDAFLQQRFFDPLGMTSTGFSVRPGDADRLASNYLRKDETVTLVDSGPTSAFLQPPAYPSGGGGLLSTARDYDRFLTMIASRGTFQGRRIMPQPAVDLGVSNLLPAGAEFRDIMATGGEAGYGAAGVAVLTGPNAGQYGWGGAAGTIGYANPRRGTRLSGYINVMGEYALFTGMAPAGRKDLGVA